MKRFRRLLVVIGAVVAILGTLVIGFRFYLRSEAGLARVTAQLETAYGGKVGLHAVDVGLTSVSLHGLALCEAGNEKEKWIGIDRVDADIGLLALLTGDPEPQSLTARGARIVLRFDAAGQMLTRFPEPKADGKPLPPVSIRAGRVTLRQAGRADMNVQGVNGELTADGNKLNLAGTVTDPFWGNWQIAVLLDPAGESSLMLKTAKVHVTQAMLDNLAFVPPDVWKQVQLEGDTPVTVTVRFAPDRPEAKYRVDLEPTETRVHVCCIDLRAEGARGKVVIEDNLVQLREVTGRSAKGTIAAEGDLDFRKPVSDLQFRIDAQRMDLRDLPDSWRLPKLKFLEGRISGKADLRLNIDGDDVTASGQGQGSIVEIKIRGVTILEPVQLKLMSEGGRRFRFWYPGYLLRMLGLTGGVDATPAAGSREELGLRFSLHLESAQPLYSAATSLAVSARW